MKTRRTKRAAAALALSMILGAAGEAALATPVAAAPALGQPPGPADQPAVNGSWGPVENWPMVAIHSALDSKGRVVTYGTDAGGVQTGRFIYDIWTPNPSAAAGHNTLANTTQTDLFCSLQLNRADTGDMILFGGDNWTGASTNNLGNPDINSLNADTGQLTTLPGMQRARWYGTGTTRPDGSMYIQGGDGGFDRPELWIPGVGSQLLDLDTSGLSWWYPRNFMLDDGRIFGVDVEGRMYYISADLSTITMVGRLGADRWGYGTTAVMFAPGRILHFGGETNTAVIIDVNGANPIVTPAAAPSAAREWVNATILPDGRILATGGASYFTAGQADGRPLAQYNVINAAEIWNPDTGQWEVETSGIQARLYHSTALLLPDGRVLVAGGGAPGPVTNTDAEIFSPDYLHAAGGGATVRPQITGLSSDDLNPGDNLAIGVNSNVDIARVTLIKSGSVTHSFNMEQRISELPFTVTGNTLNATLPASGAAVTPGYYLLTALTTEGVPSESRMIRIGSGPVTQDAPVGAVAEQVDRLYQAYFLRKADPAGQQYWVNQIQQGVVNLAQVSDLFAASVEFNNRYGQLTNEQFVDQVYMNVVGRQADPGGRAYWIAQLGAGITRGQVMLAFSESAEFINLTSTGVVPGAQPPVAPPPVDPPVDPGPVNGEAYRPEIHRLYRAYFLRPPEGAGQDYWVAQRMAGVSLITVSNAFAESPEFIATYGAATNEQFVDLVYNNVLDRVPDAEGRAYWVGLLNGGLSRGEAMIGFSESAEFVARIGPVL